MKVVLSDVKPAIRAKIIDELSGIVVTTTADTHSATHDTQLAEADIWVVGLGPPGGYQADLINAAPDLKGIIMCGLGYDHIDDQAAARRNIPVANAPEIAVSVAEAALALMLLATKNFLAMKQSVDEGVWPVPSTERGMTLSDKTLGIVGLGNIGSHTARYARALNMTVLAADPMLTEEHAIERGANELVALPDLLKRSDVVLLSCPLLDSTFHIIDGDALALMKSTAHLVNVGRGSLVDEEALIAALQRGVIAGAGLDVMEQEPPDSDNPLLTMRNVVITPHSLGATVENSTIIAMSVRRSVESLLRGERPVTTVNL